MYYCLNERINCLPENEKRIVKLRYFDNLKIIEISNILGLPLSSVKSQLYRSLKKLGKLLEKEVVFYK